MIRFLALISVLTLCLFAPMSVQAAENEYVKSFAFYPSEVSTFGNINEFRPTGNFFWNNKFLPAGEYVISFIADSVNYVSDPLTIAFDPTTNEDEEQCILTFVFPDLPGVYFRFHILRYSYDQTIVYTYVNDELVDLTAYTDVIYFDVVSDINEAITVDFIESVGSDIVHADLFGSFLVCGTLIGLALFRGIYGT